VTSPGGGPVRGRGRDPRGVPTVALEPRESLARPGARRCRASIRGGRRPAGVGLLLAVLAAAPAAGQDVEALSALRGIPLPAAYWDRVRADPDAFELPNGLFRMTAAGPQPTSLLEGTARLPCWRSSLIRATRTSHPKT
jgi:hypothetical protein